MSGNPDAPDCAGPEGRLAHRGQPRGVRLVPFATLLANLVGCSGPVASRLEHPERRVRLDAALFEPRAVHVQELAERDPILSSRGYGPAPEGITVFRFDGRG